MAKETREKRNIRRVRIPGDVYAAFSNGAHKVGLVKDICLQGLAFEYIDDEDAALNQGRVDIFGSGRKFHIRNIPCRVVYKKQLPRDSITAQFVSFVLARCGVHFQEMDEHQREALEQVMRKYM
ncbi:MAG: PilZ domain-containing protein [Deltaproteobacteria bacterium]|nr:PilZ domain-containing protein [Deltaproteobacteria bacterium]